MKSTGSENISTPKQVVILAGGLGTRLRPITEKIPKPLVDVAGEPFLHWQLLDLRRQGFKRVLLLVAYLGEQIEKRFGNGAGLGLEIEYSYEPEPLGTGGALRYAAAKLDSEFILLNGDSFLRAPLAEMASALSASGYLAVVSSFDPKLAGERPVPVIPNLRTGPGERGLSRVLQYQKDGGPALGFDLIDSGAYAVQKSLIEDFEPAQARFGLEEIWRGLIAAGKLAAFAVDERFYDIGTVDRLHEFERHVRSYFASGTL